MIIIEIIGLQYKINLMLKLMLVIIDIILFVLYVWGISSLYKTIFNNYIKMNFLK